MEESMEIVNNIWGTFGGFLVVAVAWFATQVVAKVVIRSRQEGRLYLHVILEDGGMPSSHSAITAAAFTYAALTCALNGTPTPQDALSVALGVTTVFLVITINDALKNRKATGDLTKTVNRLIAERNLGHRLTTGDLTRIKVVKGHTGAEVFVGAIVGVVITVVSYLAM
jgi:acid phosphatase family membrane protein YuiD